MNVLGIVATVERTNGWHAVGPPSALDLEAFALLSDGARFEHPVARLAALRRGIDEVLDSCATEAPPGILLLETDGGPRQRLGEWNGLILLSAYERGWTVVPVPRTVLRLYVCGFRTAAASLMPRVMLERWGYVPEDGGDCSARCLLELGLDFACGPTFAEHPAATREVLERLKAWAGAPVEPHTLH